MMFTKTSPLTPIKKTLSGFLSELMIVFLGIVLAMTAESWVADQNKATQERIYLTGLNHEFIILKLELLEYHDDLTQWLSDLSNLATPEIRNTGKKALIDLWLSRGFFGLNDFDPRTAVLDDLRATGQIALLSSNKLRHELAKYLQILSEIRELDDGLQHIQFFQIDPFLVKYGNIGHFGLMGRNLPTVPNTHWNPDALLNAAELQNLANLKMITVSYLDKEILKLAKVVQRVQQMAEQK